MGKEDDEDGMTSNSYYDDIPQPRQNISGVGSLSDGPSPFQRGDPLRVSSRKYKKPPPGRVSSDAKTTNMTALSANTASLSACGVAGGDEMTEWKEEVEEEYFETNCNIMQKLDDLRKSMEDLSASHDVTYDKLGELDVLTTTQDVMTPSQDVMTSSQDVMTPTQDVMTPMQEVSSPSSRAESPTLRNIMRKYSSYENDTDVVCDTLEENVDVSCVAVSDNSRKTSECMGTIETSETASRRLSESHERSSPSSRKTSKSDEKYSSSSRKTSESHERFSSSSRKTSESFADVAEGIRRKYSQPGNDFHETTTMEAGRAGKKEYVEEESEYVPRNSVFVSTSADVSTEANSVPLSATATSMKADEVGLCLFF